MGLKTESYPFDWLVSKLDTIKLCINDSFIQFMKKGNYDTKTTSNDIGLSETVFYNTRYEKNPNILKTYDFQLACNHYNLNTNYDYYERCVDRFVTLLENKSIPKLFLYIHPIQIYFQREMLDTFEDFTQYMSTRTNQFFIVYFVLVREPVVQNTFKYKNHDVYIVQCNQFFSDTGCPFELDSEKETDEIISILKTYDIFNKSVCTHSIDNSEIRT